VPNGPKDRKLLSQANKYVQQRRLRDLLLRMRVRWEGYVMQEEQEDGDNAWVTINTYFLLASF
jgi:hypothetical protein